ncbi:DUF2079 domain-containing protein [Vulcanisaeta thermophila]|uniref:DUF2079 domain-containing protein n=1 Tax=Vulcanisaeta thermophila TaxID=867917 RepID=UPI000852E198|nr:DUF2079 domain-containing protein [Vulcanisaeta thermophila]
MNSLRRYGAFTRIGVLASIPLLAQFYIIWSLGYLKIEPSLYNYTTLHLSAALFTTGLLLMVLPLIIRQVREAVNDRYYATTLLIYLAVTYELAYLASVPPYYSLSLGASLDTATYLQSFASMTYYRKFLVSFVGPFFSVHASPILLLIYPIYLTYPSIQWLMTIQVIILTLPMPLIYKLGMELFRDSKYALATALLYVLYPWIATAYQPFEVVTLAGTFITMTLASMYIRDKRAYWASITLAMASIEYAPIFGIGLAIYQATMREYRKWSIPTLAYSTAWLIADYYLVMYFSNGTHNIFANLYGSALSALLTQITGKILHYPTYSTAHDPGITKYLSGIAQQALDQLNIKIQYLIMTLGPLAFLNLLEPQSILLMPWLASLMTNFTPYYTPWTYYTILVGAAALPSAIWTLRRVSNTTRRRVFTALLVINTVMAILMGPLTPASGLYYGNTIPNWSAPTTNQYYMAMIQLANYIPWNATVAVPATATPWYSITRYGPMVQFLGPTQDTEYVVYSPLIPTGYPYSTEGSEYKPYIFNDGAWILRANYTGPVKVIGGFEYRGTYVINPVLPMEYQYPIATVPPTEITITINTEAETRGLITTLNTTLLKEQLQQPQGIACGMEPGPGEVPIPAGTYIAQPLTINRTTTIKTITIFTSYITGLATAQLAITTNPLITQQDTLYKYTFGTPWWCPPHSWATPITANPGITLKPGTYYVILTFPVTGQTICEDTPGMPKAILINATTGQVIKQLPCTLGIVITTNESQGKATTPSITVSILNRTEQINSTTTTIKVRVNSTEPLTLTIVPKTTQINEQITLKINIETEKLNNKPGIPWYTIPTLALTPTYALTALAAAIHVEKIKRITYITT